MLPHDAFFAGVEQVDADQAVGRISAEVATPYLPGAPAVLPAVLPGEVITKEVVEYVRSGLNTRMELPDPTDPEPRPGVRTCGGPG